MMSEPTRKFCFTKGSKANGEQVFSPIGCTVTCTNCVIMVSRVFMSFTVMLNGSHCNWRWLASSLRIQELLQAVSQRTSSLVLTFEGLTRLTWRTWRNSLTSVIELSPDKLVVPMDFKLSTVVDDVFVEYTLVSVATFIFFSLLPGKRGLTHEFMRYECFDGHRVCISFDMEMLCSERVLAVQTRKTKLFFAATLARCLGVFSLKDGHRQMGCVHLHSTHTNWSFLQSEMFYLRYVVLHLR